MMQKNRGMAPFEGGVKSVGSYSSKACKLSSPILDFFVDMNLGKED
jgi:hypothetical protein